jgi:drug/metabolite transporter (DMT)-like permease
METTGILLAVGSSCLWASFDILRKRIGAKVSAPTAIVGMMGLQLPLVLPFLITGELWAGGKTLSPLLFSGLPDLDARYWMFWAGSVSLNLIANFLFMRSVQLSPLTLSVPYLSFTPVFTALLALPLFGQTPSIWGWAGILVVCLGAFFLNPGSRKDGMLAPLKALKSQRGSLYMVIVALLWSVTPMFDKQATAHSSPLFHTAVMNSSLALGFGAWRLVKDRGAAALGAELSLAAWLFPVAACCSLGALTMQLASYQHMDIAYVETFKRAIGLIGTMIAGYLLFGERGLGPRLVGAAVMLTGVGLILLKG